MNKKYNTIILTLACIVVHHCSLYAQTALPLDGSAIQHNDFDNAQPLQKKEIPTPDKKDTQKEKDVRVTADKIHLTDEQARQMYDNDRIYEDYSEPTAPSRDVFEEPTLKMLTEQAGEQAESITLPSAFDDPDKKGKVFLSQSLYPWKKSDQDEKVELSFDNIELSKFVSYISNLFNVTFITDENLDPIGKDGKKITGNKITFKSHRPLPKKQIWDISLAFLDMAGFAIVPEASLDRTYKIIPSSPRANREPLPTFIGVDPKQLPANDRKIRYIYFVNNADLQIISNVINEMISKNAGKPVLFNDLRAIMLTDRASNIQSIMNIITELDRVTRPEVLTIVRLQRADAAQVADLFNKELLAGDKKAAFSFGPPPRKSATTQYFSRLVRVIAEPRTNSLIILGPEAGVMRVEDFITKHIDRELDLPYSPLHIYNVQHLNAEAVAEVLNQLVKFGEGTPAGDTGGVRNFDEFFNKNVQIFSESSSNSLIIRAGYDDYLKLKQTIKKLDVEQAQVALKVLVLNVDADDNKELGAQLRNRKSPCSDGIASDVSFQTSNLGTFVERDAPANPPPSNGAERLLGNLVKLATGAPAGSTLVTLGQDIYGVWGLLRVLETYTRTSVIANPFLITTHKYPAVISVGESRRVEGDIVSAGSTKVQSTVSENALLTVEVTPIISYDDMITLNIYVTLENFTQPASQTNLSAGNKISRYVQTSALVADKEVLALGGLAQNRTDTLVRKVPILGDIPFIGSLFKFKRTEIRKNNLLILITPEILRTEKDEQMNTFTQNRVNESKDVIYSGQDTSTRRQPLYKWFFGDQEAKQAATVDKFVSRQSRYLDATREDLERFNEPLPTTHNENTPVDRDEEDENDIVINKQQTDNEEQDREDQKRKNKSVYALNKSKKKSIVDFVSGDKELLG
jgi:general secretion pathway protein D